MGRTSLRVLVTGHRGYIGSVLTSVLAHARFDVVGLDSDLYSGCDFGRVSDEVPSFDIDVRDIELIDLLSFDAVIHLAALTDDESASSPALLDELNHAATIRLASLCKEAGVSRFLYASTCSVYGRVARHAIDETGPAAPIGAYANATLRCEHSLRALGNDRFTPIILRCATSYGVSPRMRLDTVVNDFVASAIVNNRIDIRTAGRAWRPVVHVEDVARAFAACLTAPEPLRETTFNVVPPNENFRVVNIAEKIAELMPAITWTASSTVFDDRSYRVDGARLLAVVPQFRYRWSLSKGIRQLAVALSAAGLTPGEWRSDRYRRALRLHKLVESDVLTTDLRRSDKVCA